MKEDFSALILSSMCCMTSLFIALIPFSSCSILLIIKDIFSLVISRSTLPFGRCTIGVDVNAGVFALDKNWS